MADEEWGPVKDKKGKKDKKGTVEKKEEDEAPAEGSAILSKKEKERLKKEREKVRTRDCLMVYSS